jgi:ferredoxin
VNYHQITIYCHSGTGNALAAAVWMSHLARTQDISAQTIMVGKGSRFLKDSSGSNRLIGFHYPTHGFSLSPAMFHFILRLPSGQGTDVYLLNTRAGGKFFKWYVPGVSGIAIYLPWIILWIKGYNVRGCLPLDLPSNWISLHPGLGPNMVSSIVNHRKKEVEVFAGRILAEERSFSKTFYLLPLDIALIPVSIAYYFIGRFFLSKTFIHTPKCNDCHLCMDQCPVKAIKLVRGKPFWTHRCESCMRCINICPQRAVQTSHLLVAAGIAFFQLPISYFLNEYFGLNGLTNHKTLSFILTNLIMLGLFYLLYSILHPLFRMKFTGRIFELTSFTYFWRRYLFPGMHASSFKEKRIFPDQTDQKKSS